MSNARTLLLCLVTFCGSAAFADMHPTSRSASAVEPNLFSGTSWVPDALPLSGHFAQLALLTPDILPPDFLPHRALPSAEPFDLPATVRLERFQRNGARFSRAFLPTRKRLRLAAQTKARARTPHAAFCRS